MIAGRYTLEQEIGRGGSGTVHLARDEVLGRTVAIKRIGTMPGADDADFERAEREARLAAALNHPHVVSVFDLVAEDDVHYLVMEYVAGQTLTEMVRAQGPLEAPEAADLLGQIADALTDAHGAGIVHRDVKPSNILISGGVAKLSDFGIARSANDASLTQTGLVTGSPAYLAPEVASGSSATEASDVWSLGATLYHAATGKPPYDVGENLIGALYKIVHEDPPRLPGEHPMAGLLTVMMTRDPTHRWPMGKVREELRRIAHGQRSSVPAGDPLPRSGGAEQTGVLPSTASLPTPIVAAPRRRTTTRWGWIAAAAVLAVGAVVAAYLVAGRDSPPPSADTTTQAPAAGTTSDAGGTPAPSPEEVSAQMDAFITSYLATVTSDPEAAFQQLTPEFQEASGGYEGYLGWWSTVESAEVAEIQSDPSDRTVAYTVNYVMTSGRQMTQDIRLQLQQRDDQFLIAGEG